MSWLSNVSSLKQQVTAQVTQGLLSATKLLESDDDAIFKKVQETHKPQGRQVDNLDGLFSIIGKILLHDNPKSDHDVPNEKSVVHEVPASLINKICCKLACNCTDRDAEETTMTILEKELQNYLWDEKLVIVAAAFAVNYGEFYLLTQLDTPDPVAKNMAFLKQLQFIKEIGSASQNLSGAINELIHAIMTVIKCVLQFSVLDPKYFEAEEQPSAPTEIARATYWTIYSVVTCGSYIAKLVGLRNQNTMAEMTSQLKTLASKVSSMQKVLQVKFSHRKHEIETYKWLINRFNTYQDHTILSDLFDVEGGKTALVVGHDNKKEVDINSLKGSNVWLLISGPDACHAEMKTLTKLYLKLQTKEQNRYHIVWLPIVDEFNEREFSSLQSLMPWYTVRNPKIIKPVAIRYIREVWKFTNETILVPLLPKGHSKSLTPRTLDPLWISGDLLSLFSVHDQKKSLWHQNLQITLDLLLGGIYPEDSSKPASILCLYGGEDIKWIEDFTTMINRVKNSTKISIDLVYVSKSNAIDHYNNAIFDFITAKKVGGYWKADETHSWHFWTRLESIFSWGIRDGKNAKINDTMRDVMSLLSFNGSYKGWAVFGQLGSSHKVVKATGEVVLDVLRINNWWKAGTNVDSFMLALNQQIEQHLKVQKHHCYHIVLPTTVPRVPDEMMICAICDRKMGKYLMYRCCE
ncbi:protein SIEVE ELEMENT OCCLUSION B-like [Hevea brasiliensis]|uniref:protein SIEVE ELEMENT OCCLUSION B-like n=1 Tax=Hevea brasiliensis TaxID=3981 RepID=UPI0025F350F7|nr:protein SIEVE ELEMENT OCCLUSION B-like [Hevea brasiliensis]